MIMDITCDFYTYEEFSYYEPDINYDSKRQKRSKRKSKSKSVKYSTTENTPDAGDLNLETPTFSFLRECSIMDIAYPVYGDVWGWEIIKLSDFWFIAGIIVLGGSFTKVIWANTGTYLRSFRLEKYASVTTVTPWTVMLAKSTVSIFGDAIHGTAPKILIILGFFAVGVPAYLAWLIWGYGFTLCFTTQIVGFIHATIFMLGPVMLVENFGILFFGFNYGCIYVATACLTLFLQVYLGSMYDLISYSNRHTCFGRGCFISVSNVLVFLSVTTMFLAVLFCLRHFMKCGYLDIMWKGVVKYDKRS